SEGVLAASGGSIQPGRAELRKTGAAVRTLHYWRDAISVHRWMAHGVVCVSGVQGAAAGTDATRAGERFCSRDGGGPGIALTSGPRRSGVSQVLKPAAQGTHVFEFR